MQHKNIKAAIFTVFITGIYLRVKLFNRKCEILLAPAKYNQHLLKKEIFYKSKIIK